MFVCPDGGSDITTTQDQTKYAIRYAYIGIAITIILLFAFQRCASSQQPVRDDVVNIDFMPVYKSTTKSHGFITVLNKGDKVVVVREIEVADQCWCHIVVGSQKEPLGYALCNDLRSRPIRPWRSASIPEKRRVFVIDSQSWAAVGGFSSVNARLDDLASICIFP